MSVYQAVLFDFDGVLVDSEPVHFSVWRDVLAPFGVDLTWDYYAAHCIGVSDRAMIETLVRLSVPPADFDAVYAEYPRKREMFRDRMLAAPPVYPETLQLLRDLSPNYQLAVVTSSGRPEVEPILTAIGVLPLFSAGVYGTEAERLKPAPDPYLKAASMLGITRALVVEDSEAGCASGRAAGFDVVEIGDAREVAVRVREALGG
jgi:HAD superfamily hydrolase (TIGR01509 family)